MDGTKNMVGFLLSEDGFTQFWMQLSNLQPGESFLVDHVQISCPGYGQPNRQHQQKIQFCPQRCSIFDPLSGWQTDALPSLFGVELHLLMSTGLVLDTVLSILSVITHNTFSIIKYFNDCPMYGLTMEYRSEFF